MQSEDQGPDEARATELEMLEAMFPEPGELVVTGAFSFTVRFRDEVRDLEMQLLAELPEGYPSRANPVLTPQCEQIGRQQMRELRVALDEHLGSQDLAEGLLVFPAIQWLQGNAHTYFAEVAKDSVFQPEPEEARELVLHRVVFWSHHIRGKKEITIDWANELNLSGIFKAGKPGWIFAEGNRSNVDTYVKRMKQQSWRRILLKWEEIILCPPAQTLDSMRLIGTPMHEVDEREFFAAFTSKGREDILRAGTGVVVSGVTGVVNGGSGSGAGPAS
jgi:hypothetical protein